MLRSGLNSFAQISKLGEPFVFRPSILSLTYDSVEFGSAELLTRIDLLLVVADFIEMALQGQVMVIRGTPLFLALPFEPLYSVNDVAHATLASQKQLTILRV